MHGQPPQGESPEERRHRAWAEQQAYGRSDRLAWWQRLLGWHTQSRDRRRALRRHETRWQRFRRNTGQTCDTCGDCSPGCDCNFPLLHLVRVSTLLVLASAVLPDRPGTRVALAGIRGYQRWLSRLTPACPSTPHCSAYAAEAVRLHGARRGLRAAAARVAACSAGSG